MVERHSRARAPEPAADGGGGATPISRDTDPRHRPRRLGDAWVGWDPSQAIIRPRDLVAGVWLLLSVLTLLGVTATAAWALVLWLAAPRLSAIGLGTTHLIWIWAFGALLLLLPSSLLWGARLSVRYPAAITRRLQGHVFGLWTLAAALGRLLGISSDRLGHSFVLVTNRLALLAPSAGEGRGLLILAPRCLRADRMRALRELAAERGAALVVAGGGEEARAALWERMPAGVLAIACERDLVAGLCDVGGRVPVLSLSNERPEGPCRNSIIDLDQARRLLDQLARLTTR